MVVSFDDDLVDTILEGPYWLNGGGESDVVTDIDVNKVYYRWPVKQVSEDTVISSGHKFIIPNDDLIIELDIMGVLQRALTFPTSSGEKSPLAAFWCQGSPIGPPLSDENNIFEKGS